MHKVIFKSWSCDQLYLRKQNEIKQQEMELSRIGDFISRTNLLEVFLQLIFLIHRHQENLKVLQSHSSEIKFLHT